jgi:general secretion pathway protein G
LKRKKPVRGFTVIELMMVIGLIAILAAVALPAYNNYRDKARSVEAVQQIAVMAAAIKTYWQDARAYPATLADVQLGGMIDPWGRPYVYYNVEANGKGGARKDHALNPLNTDFDLYSVGPDGKTKKQISQKDSLDDLIRASDGAFLGVAADF